MCFDVGPLRRGDGPPAEVWRVDMMKRFVAEASPTEILKMQQKLNVVRDDRPEGGGNQLIIVLGSHEQPLQPPGVGPDVLI